MRHLSWCRVVLGWRVEGGDIVCVCVCVCVPILQCCKECFCHSKGSLGSFASSSSSSSSSSSTCVFFLPTSILPHTFEPLCGIVPWSWLGSLLPRPRLPPGQLAHAPQIGCCQPGHGSEARSPESSEARGACPPSMRELELLLSQFRTGRVGG